MNRRRRRRRGSVRAAPLLHPCAETGGGDVKAAGGREHHARSVHERGRETSTRGAFKDGGILGG